MKQILSLLIVMLMSIGMSASAATTTGTSTKSKTENVSVPTNLIVKQSITFTDGKTITVFYKKAGNNCQLYSTANLYKYGLSDLARIQSTNFERTDHVEGKCYASKTVSALISMARNLLN